jgi:hypothetical protein
MLNLISVLNMMLSFNYLVDMALALDVVVAEEGV